MMCSISHVGSLLFCTSFANLSARSVSEEIPCVRVSCTHLLHLGSESQISSFTSEVQTRSQLSGGEYFSPRSFATSGECLLGRMLFVSSAIFSTTARDFFCEGMYAWSNFPVTFVRVEDLHEGFARLSSDPLRLAPDSPRISVCLAKFLPNHGCYRLPIKSPPLTNSCSLSLSLELGIFTPVLSNITQKVDKNRLLKYIFPLPESFPH